MSELLETSRVWEMKKYTGIFHAFIYALLSMCLLYLLHLLPINQLFIDPFSEAIKQHDLMDLSFSQFRDHSSPGLFDDRIYIINSGVTDRGELAQAIQLLNDKGVAAIGLDLLLDTLYGNTTDTLLRNAMENASGKLILGYTLNSRDNNLSSKGSMHSHPFFSAGRNEAFVNLATNDGFSVRAFLPLIKTGDNIEFAFSTKLASIVDPGIMGSLQQRNHNTEWINFRRVQPGASSMIYPINSKKTVHYIQMDIDRFISDSVLYAPDFFAGKIAIIGFCGENENSLSMNDRYFTPLNEQYTGRSLPDMHGVVIHANIISMLLDRDFIEEVPAFMIYFLSFLIFLVNYFCFGTIIRKQHFMQHIYIRLFQVLEFVFLFSIAIFFLANSNLKLSFFLIATAVILSFELYHLYNHKIKAHFEKWILKH